MRGHMVFFRGFLIILRVTSDLKTHANSVSPLERDFTTTKPIFTFLQQTSSKHIYPKIGLSNCCLTTRNWFVKLLNNEIWDKGRPQLVTIYYLVLLLLGNWQTWWSECCANNLINQIIQKEKKIHCFEVVMWNQSLPPSNISSARSPSVM